MKIKSSNRSGNTGNLEGIFKAELFTTSIRSGSDISLLGIERESPLFGIKIISSGGERNKGQPADRDIARGFTGGTFFGVKSEGNPLGFRAAAVFPVIDHNSRRSGEEKE